MNLVLSGDILNYTSNHVLNELFDVLSRKKVQQRIHSDKLFEIIPVYLQKSTLVHPNEKVSIVNEDPDDDIIFHCALAANAQFIITGDPHLLKIRKYNEINIVTAREFLTYFFKNE